MPSACRQSDPLTSRLAGERDERLAARHRRAVLLCLVFHGPISAPWIERRYLKWIAGPTIRGALLWLQEAGWARTIAKKQRSPWGCWARVWEATELGRWAVATGRGKAHHGDTER